MRCSSFFRGAHNFKGKRKNNVSFVLSSKTSCKDMPKSVWDHIRRPTERVGVSTKAFQGVISNLRSEKVVEITAHFWGWDGKDIPCRGNCMCKHVEKELAYWWE